MNKNPRSFLSIIVLAVSLVSFTHCHTPKQDQIDRPNHHLAGAGPELGISAGGTDVQSEIGVAALMPWANKLWLTTYVSHGRGLGEKGVGLYSLDRRMNLETVQVVRSKSR